MFDKQDVFRSYSTEHGIVYCADGGVCLRLEKDGDKINKYILEKEFLHLCGEIPKSFMFPVGGEFLEWIGLTLICCIIAFVFLGLNGLLYSLMSGTFVFPQLVIIGNIAIFSRISKNEAYVKFVRSRGAERKVQNAYIQKGEIPTLEEAKIASRIAKWNSSENYEYTRFLAMIFYIVILCISNITENSVVLLVGVIVYFIILLKLRSIGSFLQLITTMEPSDDELELAIEGLNFLKLYKTSTEEAFTEMSKTLEPAINQMVKICEEKSGKLDDEIDISSIKSYQQIIKKSAKGEFASEKSLKLAAGTVYLLYFELLH